MGYQKIAIDQTMVLATGFPNQRGVGGPLHWADDLGIDAVIERLNYYKDKLGPRFWPHHLLKRTFVRDTLAERPDADSSPTEPM